jgi:hypothetical protein
MNRVKIVLAVYAVIGLLLGTAMSFFIPAINILGILYYALFWPMFILQGTFGIPINWPIPEWAFSFS